MRKFNGLDALDQPRRRRSNAPLVLLLLLIVVATPPLFEVGKIYLSRWGVFGFAGRADTPLLDFLCAQWEYSHSELRDWSTPLLVARKWSPRLVVPFALFWAAAAAMMLRRSH